jgi:Flp pilus assembly protein TadG
MSVAPPSALQSPSRRFMQAYTRRKSPGQAIVEFTLLLPIIVLIVGGLTDLGVALYVSIGLQNAVREGARIAATKTGLGENDSEVAREVIRRIPARGLFTITTDDITNTEPPPTPRPCDSNVTVTATGTYSYMFLQYIGFTTTEMSRSATMRYEPGTPLCQ